VGKGSPPLSKTNKPSYDYLMGGMESYFGFVSFTAKAFLDIRTGFTSLLSGKVYTVEGISSERRGIMGFFSEFTDRRRKKSERRDGDSRRRMVPTGWHDLFAARYRNISFHNEMSDCKYPFPLLYYMLLAGRVALLDERRRWKKRPCRSSFFTLAQTEAWRFFLTSNDLDDCYGFSPPPYSHYLVVLGWGGGRRTNRWL